MNAVAFVIGAWRAATPRHFIYTAVIGLLWTALLMASLRGGLATSWSPIVNLTLTYQFSGFSALLAVLVADRATPPPLFRWWPYVLAVVSGVAFGSAMLWLVSRRLLDLTTGYGTGYEEFQTFFYRHATQNLVVWGLATFVYVRRRVAAHSVAALHALQVERATIEKQVLESQLAAMQAHVEPDFLRSTLAQVERLYEVDAPAADRLLNELTIYLRAAIPDFESPSSTVAREIRLANAYLSVTGMRSRQWLSIDGPGAAIAARARMLPMVMLPLVNHALAHRVQRARGDERFAVAVRVHGASLVVAIHDEGLGFDPGAAGDSVIREVRERLAAIHGANAKLTLRGLGEGTEAIIEVPHELASAGTDSAWRGNGESLAQ